MINRAEYIRKSPSELNKNVWELRKKDGTLLESFRQKVTGIREKNRLEKIYLEELNLVRI